MSEPTLRRPGMAAAAAGLTFSVAWQQARTTLTSPVPFILCLATLFLAAVIRAPLWATFLAVGPVGFIWARQRLDRSR